MCSDITASCLCGSARLSCGTPVGPGAYCHCEDCRRSTGGAYAVTVPFEANGFRVLAGEIGSFTKHGDSGNELTRHFCLSCGSPLYGTSPKHPGVVYVKAGVLDDQSLVQPAHQSWCLSKVAWSMIDAKLLSYPKSRLG